EQGEDRVAHDLVPRPVARLERDRFGPDRRYPRVEPDVDPPLALELDERVADPPLDLGLPGLRVVAEARAAHRERDTRADLLEIGRGLGGRVAAAGDDDVLPGEGICLDEAIPDALVRLAGDVQMLAKSVDPGGDEHRTGAVGIARRLDREPL